MKILVIHHSADFDGLFCREIARLHVPEATFLGWDYGDPVPTEADLAGYQIIYMLDISIDSLMGDPRLIWIDHHASAIAKYPADILGLRIDGVAACRLTWQWFAHNNATIYTLEDYRERRVPEPFGVRLAGEYDVWDKRDPRAETFQFGLRSRDLADVWPTLLSTHIHQDGPASMGPCHTGILFADADGTVCPPVIRKLLEAGALLQFYQRGRDESAIRRAGFTIEWEGVCFLAANLSPGFNSLCFTAGIRAEHRGLMGFNLQGGRWRFSLYGVPGYPDVDLGAIAVRYGGGGHKQACGFEAWHLPSEINGSINK